MEKKMDLGPGRVVRAFRYSLHGIAAAWRHEAAFRQQALVAAVLIPLACFMPVSLVERAVLVASVLAVMMVELLNSSIEAVVDRAGPELHPLAKRAKDMGSAAVMFAIAITVILWGAILAAHAGAI